MGLVGGVPDDRTTAGMPVETDCQPSIDGTKLMVSLSNKYMYLLAYSMFYFYFLIKVNRLFKLDSEDYWHGSGTTASDSDPSYVHWQVSLQHSGSLVACYGRP